MNWMPRLLPLVLAVNFIAVLLGVRGWRFRRRFGVSPFRFPARHDLSLAAWLSRMLVVILGALLLLAGMAAFTPEHLARFHKSEMDKWFPIIKAAGIKGG